MDFLMSSASRLAISGIEGISQWKRQAWIPLQALH
jgi:hypothetical protein